MTRSVIRLMVSLDTWYRYVTLAMLALAWLAVTRAGLADDSDDLVTSPNEIRRMFTALCWPPTTSNTPATGHDGGTATSDEPAAATASDSNCKIPEYGQGATARTGRPGGNPDVTGTPA